MTAEHMCVSIYQTRSQVADAVSRLHSAGLDMGNLSLMGRDDWAEPQDVGSSRTGEAFVYGGSQGPWWEKIWDLLPERGGFWFLANGSGPVLVAGRLVRRMAAAHETAMATAADRALSRALSLIGIPEGSIAQYVRELTNHRFLLFVHGTLQATDRAQKLLSETPATNHTLHHGAPE